jgi:Leucine-rich repeat (LRR) protein
MIIFDTIMKITIDIDTDLEQDFTSVKTIILETSEIPTEFFTDQRFPNLQRLIIRTIEIIGIECLVIQSSSLNHIMAEHCGIKNISLNCSTLECLNVAVNQLQSMDLNCPSLKYLNCCYNKLTELQLILPFLIRLECSYNELSKIELRCPSLGVLHCSNNKLTELPNDMPKLYSITCHNNPLTTLNGLEFCYNLRRISCSENLYAEVELLKHAHLPDLDIRKDPPIY